MAWGRSVGVTGAAQEPRRRPWSTTVRVGDGWLKACGPGAAAEAPLLAALRRWGATQPVLPLAVDAARGYLALPHAGEPLRDVGPDVAVWEPVLSEHAELHRRDWGDAAVSHPFGVLLVTLRSVADLGATAVARLRDAYLEPWTDLAPLAELRELAGAARRVQPVLRALAWERALRGADDAERAPWGDPVAGWLGVLAGRER